MNSITAQWVILCALNISFLAEAVGGECHTFLGFSSCGQGKTEDQPFSMPWFFVNYLHQEPKVRAAVKRADEIQERCGEFGNNLEHFIETFIGKQIRRSSKPLVELRTLSETGVSTRLLERIVEYFRERNEPVELLFDKDFDYRNLLRIFRSHYNEIVLFLKEFAETEELDDELLRAVHVYIDYIKFDEILLRFSPDLTKNPLFEMMQGSVDRES